MHVQSSLTLLVRPSRTFCAIARTRHFSYLLPFNLRENNIFLHSQKNKKRGQFNTVWAINSWYWLWNQIPQLLGLGLICPFIFKICRHISTVDAIKSPSQSNQAHDMCQSFKLLRNQKSILGLEAFWISEYQYCFEHLYHCATRYLLFKSN